MFNNFDLNQLVVMIVPLLLAVTIHEVAHGYVAHRLGDPTAKLAGRLTLNPVKHLDFFGSFLLPLVLKLSGSPIIFGYAKPVPVNFANFRDLRKSTIYVASAGVIANLALAVVSGVSFQLLFHFKSIWYTSIFRPIIMDLFHMLAYSVVINLVLAIFNLIPVPPLDGGRLFAMLLPVRLRVHFVRIEPFGMIIIIFLLITNSLDKLIPFFLNPLIKILLGR
ncbi:MAG: site-2 protease family protein [Candidatus Desulfatibia sp.]|uniref:site-2 protease family protein n=1 Tax=Candidatus Desulfatibia sp. TaxID=3101189 RepID=UPI002F2F799E